VPENGHGKKMPQDNQPTYRTPILLLFVFLAVWAVLIAIGIMRQPGADARKAIFIVSTVVAFVVLWVTALSARKKK